MIRKDGMHYFLDRKNLNHINKTAETDDKRTVAEFQQMGMKNPQSFMIHPSVNQSLDKRSDAGTFAEVLNGFLEKDKTSHPNIPIMHRINGKKCT